MKKKLFFEECASSSLDSSLRLWDLESGEKLTTIEVGPVDIWTLVYSPDDKFIVSGSHAGKINMYGAESGKQEQTLDTRGGKFTLSVAYVSLFKRKFFSFLYFASWEINFFFLFPFLEPGWKIHCERRNWWDYQYFWRSAWKSFANFRRWLKNKNIRFVYFFKLNILQILKFFFNL